MQMKYKRERKNLVLLSLVAVLTMSINPVVQASGSGGSSGGSSGSGGSGGGSIFASYDVGKKVFYEKVVCSHCLYSDLSLESDQVAEILPDLKRSGTIGKTLSYRERKSVRYFVKRRFKI